MKVDNSKLKRLKKAFKKAEKERKESFIFDEQDLATDYAKYFIEYLKSLTSINHDGHRNRSNDEQINIESLMVICNYRSSSNFENILKFMC